MAQASFDQVSCPDSRAMQGGGDRPVRTSHQLFGSRVSMYGNRMHGLGFGAASDSDEPGDRVQRVQPADLQRVPALPICSVCSQPIFADDKTYRWI